MNYNDGETEKLNLSKERWELVEDDNMSEEVSYRLCLFFYGYVSLIHWYAFVDRSK